MKRTFTLITCAALGLGIVYAEPANDNRFHSLEKKKDADKVFEENAPDDLKEAVPKFAVFGIPGKFYIGIGGSVKVTAGVDAGDPIENANEFITADISPVAPGNHTKFNLSAMQSNLYLNFVGLPDSDNQIGAFINMNFLRNYVPVVQAAYLQWRGIKAGYAYSVFSDQGATPPTIDYEGPNAATAIPVPTLNYTYHFGRHKEWSASAGLELSQLSQTNCARSRTVNQAAPDIPIALQYRWNNASDWVRLSAIMRNMNYFNGVADRNIDIVGWGISLSGTAEIVPNLRAYWTGTYGHGIASLIQDLSGGNMDLTPIGDQNRLKATKTWGAYGALQYNFTPDVYLSACYSHVRNYADPWDGGDVLTYPEAYKYAQYVSGSLFWNVNSYVTTGLEYIYGRRVNFDRSQSHDNRMQAMIQLSF
ncbi:MAG: porin [Muribaculaceae bacterium]|nr:porin [Muribaculaceae bacterium]